MDLLHDTTPSILPSMERQFSVVSMQEEYTPYIPLVKVGQIRRDELYHCSWGNASQYTLLLLKDTVPRDVFNTWRWAVFRESQGCCSV